MLPLYATLINFNIHFFQLPIRHNLASLFDFFSNPYSCYGGLKEKCEVSAIIDNSGKNYKKYEK